MQNPKSCENPWFWAPINATNSASPPVSFNLAIQISDPFQKDLPILFQQVHENTANDHHPKSQVSFVIQSSMLVER
jgi:hypothetical protein